MPAHAVPLARLSLVYSRSENRRRESVATHRFVLWVGGLLLATAIYFGVPAFLNWKHPISASGGLYFVHKVEIPIPVFTQDDPRWTFDLLGPTTDTVGQEGCALTSAAMVMAAYGVDTDPGRLNQFLMTNKGYTDNGYIYWEKAAELAPYGQIEKAYEDLPSYALIDQNLLAGNPVIVKLTLPRGDMHFVVIVGKEGWDYLVQDPAHGYSTGVYPLRYLTNHIEGLRFYRVMPPVFTPSSPVAAINVTPAPVFDHNP